MLTKNDLIDRLCGMYKEKYNVDLVPEYILSLWNKDSVFTLVDDIKYWRVKNPEIYANHNQGILF